MHFGTWGARDMRQAQRACPRDALAPAARTVVSLSNGDVELG